MHNDVLSGEFLARLRAFIQQRVGSASDADDVLQDVLLKLVERGDDVQANSLPAWLFTVARRSIIDRSRSAAPLPSAPDDHRGPVSESFERSAMQELSQCMEPLLQDLDAFDRQLLQRVDIDGESQVAIARELGLPTSTVKSRVQRARARLFTRLSACCTIERDARGNVHDYRQNRDAPCECGDDGCTNGQQGHP